MEANVGETTSMECEDKDLSANLVGINENGNPIIGEGTVTKLKTIHTALQIYQLTGHLKRITWKEMMSLEFYTMKEDYFADINMIDIPQTVSIAIKLFPKHMKAISVQYESGRRTREAAIEACKERGTILIWV